MNKQQISGSYDHTSLLEAIEEFRLTEEQKSQFMTYIFLLVEWNKKFNLTTILDPLKIVKYHFYDSLKVTHYIDFTKISCVADVGTGAGFPGLPLKIMFPHIKLVLIEVNSKKRAFLEHLIKEFGLKDVDVCGDDWRTFLRQSSYPIDYFFARASLQPDELVRIFKPSSLYKNATLIYWASGQWVSEKAEAHLVKKEVAYTIDGVQRKYVFFRHCQKKG